MQYDYGVKERGYSYEYTNVYMPLCDVFGKENVILFDFFIKFKESGKGSMNRELLELTKSVKPDVSLFCLFENEFEENIIAELKNHTKTIAYFFDDPWRRDYVRHWIKYFNYFSTPDYYMFIQYRAELIENSIFCPFGYNSNIYAKRELPFKYDVSFIGGYSPLRKWIVNILYSAGIKVHVFGRGWDNKIKFISQDEMVNIFNQSKINMNLSNGISHDISYLIWSLTSLKALKNNLLNKKDVEQVKGRHFEINACGGFQLSYFIPGLNIFYEIDREISVYPDLSKLPQMIRFFLDNEELRNTIAINGYNRSLKDHSAQSYLKKMIEKIK
ncbi:MAG: glycosyltransferase [bacterium]